MAADMTIDNNSGISDYAIYQLWCVYGFLGGALPLLYSLLALFLE